MVLGDDRELGRQRGVLKEVRYIAVLLGAMSFVKGGLNRHGCVVYDGGVSLLFW